MDKQEVKQFFDNFSRSSTMQRIDAKHPLDIFLGLSDEGLKTLFVISKIEFGDVKSSKGILVNEYKKDNENILTFKLKDKTIEDIIEFHYHFENIHPFQDGNGRIGRLIMFKECLTNNIVPFIIEDEIKMYYYQGLREWQNEKGFLLDTCLSAQDKYKKYLDYFKIKY